ncbi:hypothetical protein [Desulfovibrio cuneatus]|uniref:hypothetical protein n=1 Tax=Desulfovibrio cuneatus TaxID=159728 RepID=UPI0004848510|nr:hypothetical protein [Desulfovibrio cuneatus]
MTKKNTASTETDPKTEPTPPAPSGTELPENTPSAPSGTELPENTLKPTAVASVASRGERAEGAGGSATPHISTQPERKDVDSLIDKEGLPAWHGAALCRAEGWAPGKQVTQQEFADALMRLSSRRLGG